jgi:hypothetical protein
VKLRVLLQREDGAQRGADSGLAVGVRAHELQQQAHAGLAAVLQQLLQAGLLLLGSCRCMRRLRLPGLRVASARQARRAFWRGLQQHIILSGRGFQTYGVN